jgi:hypothetical protein
MKKTVLFVLVFALVSFAVFSQSDDDFMYAIRNRGIIIIGYSGRVKDVKIPEIIDGLPVVAIYEEAFRNNQLTSVIIPDSVVSIESKAFAGNRLTGVVIPNSVRRIADDAFDPDVVITREEIVEE